MDRRIILIIAIIIIAFLLFSFVVLPLIGAIPFTASMTGQWYNGDEPVGNPFAFLNPDGVEVTDLRVTITWTGTGVNIDPDSFSLAGFMTISLQEYGGTTLIELHRSMITASGADGLIDSREAKIGLAYLLDPYMDQSDLGWSIVLDAKLTAEVTDVEGNPIVSTWDAPDVTYLLTWSRTTTSFSLTGTIFGGIE